MLGGSNRYPAMQHLLETGVLAVFLGINLYSVKATGLTEDIIVLVKVMILALFAGVGLFFVKRDHLLPVFDQGEAGMLMGAALIFVAYEGFELIPNAVHEMKHPERNLMRGIVISILVTTAIYVLVSLVAVGTLAPEIIDKDKEYALAVAAKPFLGRAGFLLIGLGALLSTASAINATMFGTARLSKVMAEDKALPRVFSHRERTRDIPWVSLCVIAALTLLFVNLGDLTVISSFASATFLLIFAIINFAALRLRRTIRLPWPMPLAGLVLCLASWLVLGGYLWRHDGGSLIRISLSYVAIGIAEFVFSKRGLFRKAR